MTPTPTQSYLQTALRAFLLQILPPGTPVVAGQVNRVAEPAQGDFVVMTPIMRRRIETNTDLYLDTKFTASIIGTTLTVITIFYGTLEVGKRIFGVGVVDPTTIVGIVDAIYTVDVSQTVDSETMAAGVGNLLAPFEVTMQLDVHGPNSADNAATIEGLFRDPLATLFFHQNYPAVAPLHADDSRQIPFINAEAQYETRYVIDAHLQINQTFTIAQQFADQLQVTLIRAQNTPVS